MDFGKTFMTVTSLSKILAAIVFIAMPFLGFYFGVQHQKLITPVSTPLPSQQHIPACTQESKICPDGSAVSRTGPNCEFAACPTNPVASQSLTCLDNAKYRVVSKQIEAVASDILVKYKASGGENIPCNYLVDEADFEIKGLGATYVYALTDNFLLLDTGTAPTPRKITVYDLNMRKEVYNDFYSTPTSTKDDSLTYWTRVDEEVTITNCPEVDTWAASALGATIEAEVTLDLSTLTKKDLGERRCSPLQ